MRVDLSSPNLDDIKKEEEICFMPYNGGTPSQLIATIPSTLSLLVSTKT